MKREVDPNRRGERGHVARRFHLSLLAIVGLTTWVTYAATATGTLSSDPYIRFTVVERLLRDGTITMVKANRLTVEHAGEHFSVFFPGQSVVFLPPAALVPLFERVGLSPATASITARFIACVALMTAFSALAVVGHVRLLRLMRVGPRIAVPSAAILAFGTPMWVWGSYASEEVTLGAIAVWSIWAILDARRIGMLAPDPDDRRRSRCIVDRLGLAGVLLAAGMVHRSTFITMVVGAGIVAVPVLIAQRADLLREARRFGGWIACGVIILALVPLYNQLRFGDPLDTGYTRFYREIGGVFGMPLLKGLQGHLLSPGKSVFIYAPWLLLVLPACLSRRVRQRMGLFSWGLLATVVLHLLIYSAHTFWAGAFGWGVRFHVFLMPLVMVPIAIWVDGLSLRRAGRIGLTALATVSIAVQLVGNALNTGLEHFQHPEYYSGHDLLVPEEAAWTWEGNQLRLRVLNLADKFAGRSLDETLSGTIVDGRTEVLTAWNIFPIRARAAIGRGWLINVLWVMWFVCVTMAIYGVYACCRRWRRETAPRPADSA